ncbi:DUF1963 domain-containing protein [Mangrovimonas sp. YM274]|uniref:DUF1963 domain-containing protein n=1 Tax=Mangrovimonas sp. YM274 TaxID=3070660 RepID=UPI0027DC1D71|nr:DUF1963 domain-containing protein [Mangrovimonas sp. YM274]WMI68232.1 DUF1963 domain-containing protein [Mangrovimonas sp. YM274]
MWNIFKKLFSGEETKEEKSHFDKYRDDLKAEGLSTYEDLIGQVKPLLKKATKLIVEKPSRPPENSQLKSHFGGQPYFEENEEWPKTKSGKNFDFIFQIFNNTDNGLPDDIQLFQFYYDFDEFPWDSDSEGWLVKTYDKINEDEIKMISRPTELEKSKYCELTFEPIVSLPDWQGLYSICPNANKLSGILNEDSPWENYEKVCKNLIGEQDYQSQIGGYPKWIQGESTPRNPNNSLMDLLIQIDSEENSGIMWGDQGMIYFFYNIETRRIEFMLQCY